MLCFYTDLQPSFLKFGQTYSVAANDDFQNGNIIFRPPNLPPNALLGYHFIMIASE